MCLRSGAKSLKPREIRLAGGKGGVEKGNISQSEAKLLLFFTILSRTTFLKKKIYYTVIFIVRRRGMRRYKSIKKKAHS